MLVGWGVGVFNKGVELEDRLLIKEVVREEMTTDDGVTTKQAIAQILRSMNSIDTKVGGIESEMSEIREALIVLARDP
jgi:hypothetical protein